jgi:hypothetical protein
MNGFGSSQRPASDIGVVTVLQRLKGANDKSYLMSVRKAAQYLGRTERAVRHLYERRILTPSELMAGSSLIVVRLMTNTTARAEAY